jgi:hypothetical protein
MPTLVAAQAHKEITHNEALQLLDFLLHPVAISLTNQMPTGLGLADAGSCWIVDAGANGAWDGRAGQLACWTGDGWRFASPVAGMVVRLSGTGSDIIYVDNQWIEPPVIADPVGGAVVDAECRAALVALLNHFRGIGALQA